MSLASRFDMERKAEEPRVALDAAILKDRLKSILVGYDELEDWSERTYNKYICICGDPRMSEGKGVIDDRCDSGSAARNGRAARR